MGHLGGGSRGPPRPTQEASLRPSIPLLVAVFAAVLAAESAAGKPPPRVTPLAAEPAGAASPAPAPALESVCTLGISGGAAFSVEYLLPPDDAYYLRVRPTRCAGCPDSAGVWVSTVQLTLDFPLACDLPVEIALVHAKGDSACAPPDPARLISTPVVAQLSPSGTGLQSFTLPLGQSYPVGRDAFVRVTFTGEGSGCAGDGNRPKLVTTASCTLCVAYNYYPTDQADLCALLLPGLPLISAPADSCVSIALAGVEGAAAPRPALAVYPNPAAAGARFALTLAREAAARVDVCDVAGRRVRAIFDGALPAGTRGWTWDGRDDAGTRQRAGVYFVRVRAAGVSFARALVLRP